MSDLQATVPGQKTGYRVQLAVFEGPLDLLLHLIEREELDITRVSLAQVADQYLEYLSALERLQVDDLSDFITVAARLLLIKSRSLLPRPPLLQQQEVDDAGDELVRQLLAYKTYKEAAQRLGERQELGRRSYVRLASRPRVDGGIEHLEAVSLDALVATAQRALRAREPGITVDNVVTSFPITISDQIEHILQTLRRQPRVSFVQLLTAAYSRQEIAVTLLSVLELIKQQEIQARQDRMFGEIFILRAEQRQPA